jgi:hypothetical protein
MYMAFTPSILLAGQTQFNYELNLLAGYEDGDAVYVVPGQRPAVGFEYYRVVSGEYGDVGRVDIQARFSADPNGAYESPYVLTPFHEAAPAPAVHVELHNAYGHVKAARGRADLWLGHRDVAFGLEPTLDTHGAMLQTFAFDTFGFKKDWGAGVQGRFEKWDYRAAATLGSGVAVAGHGNWLAAGRLGFLDAAVDTAAFGLSAAYGEVLPTRGLVVVAPETRETMLTGMDFALRRGRFGVRAEGILGYVVDAPAGGYWVRGSASFPDWRWLEAAVQGSAFYEDLYAGPPVVRAGAELTARYNAALTPGLSYFLVDDGSGPTRHAAFFHLYYFYPTPTRWLPERR